MPSPHPRVGLVVDEAMDRTLTRLAGRRPGDVARAGVARWAIFEGEIFEAVLEQMARAELHGDATPADPRATFEVAIRQAIDTLDLPQDVVDRVRAQLDHASVVQHRALRRRRQLALLDTTRPSPGLTAQDVVDDIETADDPLA
ncbi:hypothetical protein [Conexibacter woesei]|uniref:hypothetical protein n=1 Tax=Conexibacter woesei TaxID=191495 RepID=UPI0012DF0D70|nr:hypothetical protein [Conexibacter woesei]